jgi:hypothetical protein
MLETNLFEMCAWLIVYTSVNDEIQRLLICTYMYRQHTSITGMELDGRTAFYYKAGTRINDQHTKFKLTVFRELVIMREFIYLYMV